LISEEQNRSDRELICNETLLSRTQYRYDVTVGGHRDARPSRCLVSPKDLDSWDNASPEVPEPLVTRSDRKQGDLRTYTAASQEIPPAIGIQTVIVGYFRKYNCEVGVCE
jgi:hypothetical protein